ncbi:hypothetical protein E2C01_070149 [Portunus trituberculatus]|uniref:Uncharacterized protein n=1 Tax=Portunus trituberculatus TaxID=210409 RepID=A0A5B7I0T7_PORTR|nr:hypothetical protein [Portunus trituberculatus]
MRITPKQIHKSRLVFPRHSTLTTEFSRVSGHQEAGETPPYPPYPPPSRLTMVLGVLDGVGKGRKGRARRPNGSRRSGNIICVLPEYIHIDEA